MKTKEDLFSFLEKPSGKKKKKGKDVTRVT